MKIGFKFIKPITIRLFWQKYLTLGPEGCFWVKYNIFNLNFTNDDLVENSYL